MADDNVTILNEVNFTINEAETVAIIGESGAGKSTLLGLMAGLDLPNKGEIIIDGQDICKMDENKRAEFRANYMGFVFQSFQLLPSYTALENVMLPLELLTDTKGISAKQIRERAMAHLDEVGLSHRHSHYPHQLSGGEQQRVALARAFVTTPKILFADEPTGNLDQKTSHIISDLLFELNAVHKSNLVVITHSPILAARCEREFVLENASVFESSKKGENGSVFESNSEEKKSSNGEKK